jgi:hypothetical protein
MITIFHRMEWGDQHLAAIRAPSNMERCAFAVTAKFLGHLAP